jgi:peroxiredoxin
MIRASALAMLLAACGGSGVRAPPMWERPGLGGAVRPDMGPPQPGDVAPALALPDLEGNTRSLASMRGRWVLLHFTAMWCPFCDSEVEHLGVLARAMAPRGVQTVIVDIGEAEAKWHEYARAHVGGEVLALHDASGGTAARFAPPRAQPSFEDRTQAVLDATLIVDPEGKIRLFLLPDSVHFDPTFHAVRMELERMVAPPVVAVSTSNGASSPGELVDLHVRLQIARGYHIMSDRPSEPTYVATRVDLEGAAGIMAGDAIYPSPTAFEIERGRSIPTFEGVVDVRVPVRIEATATPGPAELRGIVRYQACTATRCLFPTSQAFKVGLIVETHRHCVPHVEYKHDSSAISALLQVGDSAM